MRVVPEPFLEESVVVITIRSPPLDGNGGGGGEGEDEDEEEEEEDVVLRMRRLPSRRERPCGGGCSNRRRFRLDLDALRLLLEFSARQSELIG